MIRKNRKKSSKTVFLLYAVIWGLCGPVGTGVCAPVGAPAPAAAQVPVSNVEDSIRSLDDPFDVQTRAPGIVELFLKGLAEIKKQLEPQEKPVQAKIVEPVDAVPVVPPVPLPLPKQDEPVKKKLEIPQLKVTGIVYDTEVPQAIINGKVVGVGAVVDGVSILKIQKGRVDARYEGTDITLKFNNE